jgi:hypothetical protein
VRICIFTMKLQGYRRNATRTAIRLVVRLPLRGADRVMTLLRSVSLPVYFPALDRHIQIEPETLYLAVTENRQYYSLLTMADLQQCQLGIVVICAATFSPIHKTRASCSSALYFGQKTFIHQNCRKVILGENFNPVWIYVKGVYPFWIYSMPSAITVTKSCRSNGTTRSSTMYLSHTDNLMEDTHCQMYSEAFILLPVSDVMTNVTITTTQVFLPRLPELMSPEENDQIRHDESRTQLMLTTLDGIARRNSPASPRSHVDLRELLSTMTNDGPVITQFMWIYVLIALNVILLFITIVSYHWSRSFLIRTYNFLSCSANRQPSSGLTTIQMDLSNEGVDLGTLNCPRCANVTAASEVGEDEQPTHVERPKPGERVFFAKPGKFRLRT